METEKEIILRTIEVLNENVATEISVWYLSPLKNW